MLRNQNEIKTSKLNRILKKIAENNRNPDDFQKAMEINENGRKLEVAGQLEQAINEYRRAIELIPEFVDPYINMAIVYRKKGYFDEAMKSYEKVKELYDDWPELNYNFGVLYGHMGKFDDAITFIEKEREIYGDDLKIHIALADCYDKKSQIESKRIIDAGKFSDNDLNIVVNLLEKALIEYKEALKLDPEDTETQKIFNDMCQNLDKLKPGRFQELGINPNLGRIKNLFFLDNLKERPGGWSPSLEIQFPQVFKSIAVFNCFSDSQGVQWIFADLIKDEKVSLEEYENLTILGHLIMNSKGEVEVLAYDQTGTSIVNADEKTMENLVQIAEKYFYECGFWKLAKKVIKIAYEVAKTDVDKIGCLFNLGYFTLFGPSKISIGDQISSPKQFNSVPSKDIKKAESCFSKITNMYGQLPIKEQEEMASMFNEAKRMNQLLFSIILGRSDIW